MGFVNRSWANLDNCQTFMKLPEPLVPGGDIAQLRIKSGSWEEELRGKSQEIKNHRKEAEKRENKRKTKKGESGEAVVKGNGKGYTDWTKKCLKKKKRSLTAEVKGIKGLL